MKYIPPFQAVRGLLQSVSAPGGKRGPEIRVESIQTFVRALLAGLEIDERWYLNRYPDIAEAVAAGTFKSGRQHFISDGYFEGRVPFTMQVDSNWYLAQYPEIADAIAAGVIHSAQRHFDEHGYREGRLPFPL